MSKKFLILAVLVSTQAWAEGSGRLSYGGVAGTKNTSGAFASIQSEGANADDDSTFRAVGEFQLDSQGKPSAQLAIESFQNPNAQGSANVQGARFELNNAAMRVGIEAGRRFVHSSGAALTPEGFLAISNVNTRNRPPLIAGGVTTGIRVGAEMPFGKTTLSALLQSGVIMGVENQVGRGRSNQVRLKIETDIGSKRRIGAEAIAENDSVKVQKNPSSAITQEGHGFAQVRVYLNQAY